MDHSLSGLRQELIVDGSSAEVLLSEEWRVGLPWGEMAGKHLPLATGLIDVEDGVHDVPKLMFSLSFLRINDFFDNLPLISVRLVEY